ncbi:MAG: NAD-dependent epimerase/dehydratase family protein [Solirubrobacterales bacterium]
MRALVTGGCGFVGAGLCRRLCEAGEEVIALDDLSLGSETAVGADVRLLVADVRDPDLGDAISAVRPEIVFHLAAIHYIPACEEDPAKAVAVNVEGTQRVLDAAAAAGAAAVVLASSAAVYTPSPDAHGEDAELGPTDVYGHTKLWAEQLAGLFRRRTGVHTAIARLFNVYGPGETNPHLIPTILRQAELGSELRLGNVTTRRGYLFVDDATEALASLGARALVSSHSVANIGGSRDYDASELVDSVAGLLGRELTIRADESRLRRSDRPRLAADCSWAEAELGWEPRTSLEEGLRAAAQRPLATGVEVS